MKPIHTAPSLVVACLAAALSVGACAGGPDVREAPAASLLCVVRHAEAYKNLDPPPEGLTPEQLDTLTPNGEDQARALRSALPAPIGRVLTSPANRAAQTAALLEAGAVETEPALRSLRGELAWDERAAGWARGEDLRPEGGESLADGAARAAALVERLREDLGAGEHAVVVTHGDIVSILLGASRGTPLLERPSRDTLGNGQLECVPMPEPDAVAAGAAHE